MEYTVIFAETKLIGSRRNVIVRYEHIETKDGETLNECLEKNDLDWNSVYFVFEGWCKPVDSEEHAAAKEETRTALDQLFGGNLLNEVDKLCNSYKKGVIDPTIALSISKKRKEL